MSSTVNKRSPRVLEEGSPLVEEDVRGDTITQYPSKQSRWFPWSVIVLALAIFAMIVLIAILVPLALVYGRGGDDPDDFGIPDACGDAIGRLRSFILNPNNTTPFSTLSTLTATFGNRYSGSPQLESAIQWLHDLLETTELDNVMLQPVTLNDVWVRGNTTTVTIHTPHFNKSLSVLALGRSAAGDISSAPFIVVNSFQQLGEFHSRNMTQGRIVVYNTPWVGTTYGASVNFRRQGAAIASQYNAIACLVRSVTPYSLNTPHTGSSDASPIPNIAITPEDAELLQYYQDNNYENISISLFANCYVDKGNPRQSYNVIGQITGEQYPDQIVVLGGHIDSWDVGTGAMDDATGVIVSFEAIRAMRHLDLKPKRTIRFVAWTDEENGAAGAEVYQFVSLNEWNETHVLAMESDSGTNEPRGVNFTGVPAAEDRIKVICGLAGVERGLGGYNTGGSGVDITPITSTGVPGMNLDSAWGAEKYFWYHHTQADTIDKINAEDMKRGAYVMAVHAFCVANMEEVLPSTRSPQTNL